MKRVISLLLSVVILFSVVGAVDLSACANDDTAPEYLTEDDALFFTATFLGDLSKELKSKYIDLLVGNTNYDCREGLHNETEWSMLQVSIGKVQSKWSKILKYMPDSVSDSQIAKLGNSAFKYISSTVDIFKNIDYIINEDENILEQAYHSLDVVSDCCTLMGIALGPLGIVISALKGVTATILFLYNALDNAMETITINGYRDQLGFCNITGEEYPEPPKTYLNVLFEEVESEFVYQECCKAYIRASLMRMAKNMQNGTVVNPIGEKCNFAGHTYQVFDISKNWTEAKEYCENLGGHLVTITNSDEQNFVYDLVKFAGKDTYWLGATDVEVEGEWKWITGEPFEYQNGSFDNGPPGPEDWLEMIASSGRWNDGEHDGDSGIYSLQNHGFICEWDNYIDPFPTMNDEHHYLQTVISSTCTTDGYTINKCTDCELEYYSNNVPKLGHNYNLTKKVAPTCTVQGYDLYTCSRCNSTEKRNTVSATGHNYTFTKTVSPTCTAQGYDLYTCSACTVTEKRNTISATGHKYVLSNHIDSTCNTAGYDKYICSVCKNTYQDEIDTLDGSVLTASLEKAQTYLAKDYFTETSMLNLQTVYDKHKNDLDTLTNQEGVDNAVTEINTAISNLVLGDSASGKTEEGFSWNWERNSGILTVSGSGAMPNYNSSSMPWYDVIPFATEIIVSDGITSIGKYAFYKTENAKNIVLPNTLTTINERAFEYCSAVEKLIIPDTVTSIGYGTFANMANLKEVIVPASTTYRSYCFDSDKAIEKVTITYGVDGIIPNSTVTQEQSYIMDMFYKRTGNFGPWKYGDNVSVVISEGITTVGYNTFWQALGISSIYIPSTVNELNLNDGVFYQNFNLKEITVDEKNQAYCSFNNCLYSKDKTQFLLYPQGATETTFIMPESVKEIRSYAFYDCNHLEKVKLNENLINIGTYAFGQCDNLQYISILNSECYIDSNNYTIVNTATIEGFKGSTAEEYANNHSMNFIELQNLEIKTASLSLESSITMNFKVLKSAVSDFEKPYLEFECNGEKTMVRDYTEQGDYLVFAYKGISPQMLGDEVTAVLCGEHNGIEYKSESKSLSVKGYIDKLLPSCTDDSYATLRTVLVDLLNYGAAAQIYRNYKTDNLVNADLTDEQKAWGTSEVPILENITDKQYESIDNPAAQWNTAGLVLNDSVMLRAKFTASDIENLTVKISCNGREFTYSKDDFVSNSNGTYYVYCDELYADEMSENIFITAYNGDEKCSNTLLFSVESYAKAVQDNYPNTPLKNLTDAMMCYGKSAEAYRK